MFIIKTIQPNYLMQTINTERERWLTHKNIQTLTAIEASAPIKLLPGSVFESHLASTLLQNG